MTRSDRMTREEVIARLCALQAEVVRATIGYNTANDCFCRDAERGGQDKMEFRSDGTALEFIERAVRGALYHQAGAK